MVRNCGHSLSVEVIRRDSSRGGGRRRERVGKGDKKRDKNREVSGMKKKGLKVIRSTENWIRIEGGKETRTRGVT